MLKQFNGLTPAQAERLFYLLEELGEVQQAIGKILRHGYMSYDPTKDEMPRTTNRMMLERELGDVERAVHMLVDAGDVNPDHINAIAAKGPPSKYMHHQKIS